VGRTGRTVCHKCAVPFDPICAKSCHFNTSAKRFRSGLAIGKSLIRSVQKLALDGFGFAYS